MNYEDDNAVIKTVEMHLCTLNNHININADGMKLSLYEEHCISLRTNVHGNDIFILQEELVFVGRNQFPSYE
jgi:hypothetical protein